MIGEAVCRTCGTEALKDARFCHRCGSPVVRADAPAEFKQVTILFADVVRSMDIAAAVGAERLREIMSAMADRCAAVVNRFGGTVDKFTGDGIMAVFGAPVAMEDHAIRACLAASKMQEEVDGLAVEVQERDGVELRLRIGLNSGQVIAGEVGSGPFGYTTIGEQVGMAQRMESVAPPGGVMLSASTARLVDGEATLAGAQAVRIKGVDEPVPARRLLSIAEKQPVVGRAESSLVERQRELSAVAGLLQRVLDGRGVVVGIAGPAGIGKSRLVREVAATASSHGVDVFTAFCESHASQVPFHMVSRLLRAVTGITGLDAQGAREQLCAQLVDADPGDVLLFEDLLGISDPEVPLPRIDADARRRRLMSLVTAILQGRQTPAMYVIEDAHWMDEVSASMLADLLTVIPRTPSLLLFTYRPEYRAALTRLASARTIFVAPLSDSGIAALLSELLGPDPSVGDLRQLIGQRAAGNPFFAEEMVRDLAERGVLHGRPGAYLSHSDVADVSVPPTLQTTIGARIDRLASTAKHTLNAAAVVGARFDAELLGALVDNANLEALITAELVERVGIGARSRYAFVHPLIRTVAYESQLKSDRALLHRRVADAIQGGDAAAVDSNAALIAEHLEKAGDLRAAFDWHMRAGTWLAYRDIQAARRSWERALQIADRLGTDDPGRKAMRIAPRTMLCGSAWQGRADISGRFQELRELCTSAEDRPSLAIGMTGLVADHLFHARVRQASRLASEYMTLLDSIGDPALTIALSVVAIFTKLETGETADALHWSQTAVDSAGGDPTTGNLIMGCPLAALLALRGLARCFLGHTGWRQDMEQAVTMARAADPLSHVLVVAYKYIPLIASGVLLADDTAVSEIEEALQIAERSSDDDTLGNARSALGLALVHRGGPDCERGLHLLEHVREMSRQQRYSQLESPLVEVYAARQRASCAGRDVALPLMRAAVNELFNRGQAPWCAPATQVLVQTLLARGEEADVDEAQAAVDRLATAPVDDGVILFQVILLRLRALLAQVRGNDAAYRQYRDRYRAMATSLGFEGHMKWADEMS